MMSGMCVRQSVRFSKPEDAMILNRGWFWLGAAMLLPVFIFGQNHGLWRHGEMRVVEIGREMYVSGNWSVPTLNGEVFLEKPPLMFASVALSFRLGHKVSENLARIPSTIYALLGAISIMLIGRRIASARLGLWAGLVLSTCMLYFVRAHQCSLDIALAAFISLSLLSFLRIYKKDKTRYSFLEVIPLYIFATLAFYTKGFIGILFPGLAIVTFLLWMRDLKAIRRLRPWLGLIVFLALTAPWFVKLWQHGGNEYLRIFLVDNHLLRFVQTSKSYLGHHTRWYWYFQIIWKFFEPWSLFLIPAGVLLFRRKFRMDFSGPGRILILSWFISGFLFLTVSSTKREVYLLPVLPPCSLAVAAWIEYRARTDPGPVWEQVFAWVFAVFLLGLSAWLPLYCATHEQGGSLRAVWFLPLSLMASMSALYFLLKKNRARFYTMAMVAAWVLALIAAIFYLPIYSLDKDASRFCRRVAEITTESEFIYALHPREMEYGYIGFYTGKRVKDLRREKRLLELALSASPVFVVMVAGKPGSLESNPEYVRKKGAGLELVYSEPVGERVSALWRLLPSKSEGPGGPEGSGGQEKEG
jgi:4-amino-4-deoxy-L-arabinose transferase-like glycosyltransferase